MLDFEGRHIGILEECSCQMSHVYHKMNDHSLNGMSSVWNSNQPRQIILSFRSLFSYMALKPALQKSLDGCYTKMLRAVLNNSLVSVRGNTKTAHAANKSLYEGIPRLHMLLTSLCTRDVE